MAFKVGAVENDLEISAEKESVSLINLFVLVHRTCASILENNRTPEEFYPCMDLFVKNKLKSQTHKSIFKFILDRFKNMDFEKVKQECVEIPARIAEKGPSTYKLLVKYDICHLMH